MRHEFLILWISKPESGWAPSLAHLSCLEPYDLSRSHQILHWRLKRT